ncbi:hypothetical protein P8C59_006627 [Phyllachora maydis]|uniref:Uncharacterized protein n=1 Tax=Phyllachora maydis TaxID=1825666 RepID=A0AAD9I6T3_9PEZI|nr:hypothetical protein P8C59_006627 [Phyllachora maydis]
MLPFKTDSKIAPKIHGGFIAPPSLFTEWKPLALWKLTTTGNHETGTFCLFGAGPVLDRGVGSETSEVPSPSYIRRSSARWFLPIPAYISIPQPQLVPNISLPPGFDKDQETDSCKHTASKKQYAAAAAAAVSTATTRGQTHIISHLSKAAAVRPGSTTTALAPRSLPRFASLDRRLHALLGE